MSNPNKSTQFDEILLRHGTTGIVQVWFTRKEVLAIVNDLFESSSIVATNLNNFTQAAAEVFQRTYSRPEPAEPTNVEECQYPDCVSQGKDQRCANWKADECPEPGELI